MMLPFIITYKLNLSRKCPCAKIDSGLESISNCKLEICITSSKLCQNNNRDRCDQRLKRFKIVCDAKGLLMLVKVHSEKEVDP